ncbi:MAG TPA: rhodanese-like domain-containing protein [Rubricoccaceae bacterium]|nr:rhodanese-like domain-containing protein [Rubricoccaceae bacterium]
MILRQLTDRILAQHAYLIGCRKSREAIVIDPERDVDRYVEAAARERLRLVAAAETHIHADFLSGARELAERHGVRLYLSAEGGADWQYRWAQEGHYGVTLLRHGDTFMVGRLRFEAVHTPGHTPEHLCYFVTDLATADAPIGLASGDFVFAGDVGRPDLLEAAAGEAGAQAPSARALYGSLQHFQAWPDYLQVWPGHGAGSACGKALGDVPQTTVGYEKRFNPSVTAALREEDTFVEAILAGQTEPPLYFGRMKRLNRDGVPLLGDVTMPPRRAVTEVVARPGAVVLDTRPDRSAFMRRHVPGALYAPLGGSFGTIVGSLVPDPETPLFLIVEEGQAEEAVRALARIGYDHVEGYVTPEAQEAYWAAGGEADSIEEIEILDLEARQEEGGTVVDVRYSGEYAAGHVPGAVLAPYTRLPEHLADLPGDGPLLVHCGGGTRAAAAVSYLAREGRDVVYVNGSFAQWAASAPEVATGQEA